MNSIILGGGCFWCTEAVYSKIKGIATVFPGYAGGITKDPTYEQICSGKTDHAEVIQIKFDASILRLETILEIFWQIHDPTTLNRQGNDIGTQYRSIILVNDKDQQEVAKKSLNEAQDSFDKGIVTEIQQLEKFYPAEPYHKDYYLRNTQVPYCQFVIAPKLKKLMDSGVLSRS